VPGAVGKAIIVVILRCVVAGDERASALTGLA